MNWVCHDDNTYDLLTGPLLSCICITFSPSPFCGRVYPSGLWGCMRRGVIALDYMAITAYVDLPNASTLFWTICVQKIVPLNGREQLGHLMATSGRSWPHAPVHRATSLGR
ncbi:Exocyst complex component 1 [Fusarium oxysporum f. sp. albedinis]|nr:Exocyst complex component 1 [Fusarium oxysporum f. sp. albedinis]